MIADFTDNEKTLLKGHLSGIAKKHNCSVMYVELIVKGKRNIDTPLAKKIYQSLKDLAEFLTPETDL